MILGRGGEGRGGEGVLQSTVDSGYQAHALVGTVAKIYALHNEVRHIARVKG